jgi:hypothetical protein
LAGYDYIDFIHPKHAGWPGRDSPGRYGGLKSLALLRPIPDVGKRRITPAKFAIRAKLYHPSTFADRRFKPDGISALSDQTKCPMTSRALGAVFCITQQIVASSVTLTETQEIAPYPWVHPDEER